MAKNKRARIVYDFDVKEFERKPDFELLKAWMRDMKAWGEEVRDDIIRLEAALGVATGDPGDPPPAPRVKTT